MAVRKNFKVVKVADKNTQEKIVFKNGGVFATIRNFKFKDGDTFIVFAPSVNISGYGETQAKALEMLQEAIKYYLSKLSELKPHEKFKELRPLGWNLSKYPTEKQKEYSKSYIDSEGILQNFDIKDGKLEEIKKPTKIAIPA